MALSLKPLLKLRQTLVGKIDPACAGAKGTVDFGSVVIDAVQTQPGKGAVLCKEMKEQTATAADIQGDPRFREMPNQSGERTGQHPSDNMQADRRWFVPIMVPSTLNQIVFHRDPL